MVIRSGQTKQCNQLCGLSSVPPGTSGAKPGHLGVPKTTFGIPGQSVPNRDCPGKTGTVGQLVDSSRDVAVATNRRRGLAGKHRAFPGIYFAVFQHVVVCLAQAPVIRYRERHFEVGSDTESAGAMETVFPPRSEGGSDRCLGKTVRVGY